MKRVIVKYGVGYGSHEMDLEFEDAATDEEIESDVEAAVTERLDWSWKLED
jgi:hypothetical protein